MPHTTDRPDWACVTCRPPTGKHAWNQADPGYRTCNPCYDRIRRNLTEIGQRWERLDPTPNSSVDLGSRGSPGFGSRSPASDHIIAMRDPRSSTTAKTWLGGDGRLHKESEHPPLSVYGVLETIAYDVAEGRRQSDPEANTVPQLVRFIDGNLDWITRHPIVAEVAEQLHDLIRQLKPATGDGRRSVGRCPNTLDEGDTTRTCGTRLYAPTSGESIQSDSIRCAACGREWHRSEWLRLVELLDAG